jgi:hypothetical protein
VNISTISPILTALARVLLIGSIVSLGFVSLLLFDSERTKKLISRIKH